MIKTTWHYTFGGVTYDLAARTHIMGVLNVTPDSFSDGGKYLVPEKAVEHALQMADEGADIIDVGGESTRPQSNAYGKGADPVDAAEELNRILPVVQQLARQSNIPISIDTYKSEVAARALDAGAVIVNDISGLAFDGQMAETVGTGNGSIVLMHMKGTPKTMQVNPTYSDLFGEVSEYLSNGIKKSQQAGIKQILLDPGIGFGKSQEHNLRLLNGLRRLTAFGYPLLIGASRKSFIGTVLNLPPEERLEGSIAAAVVAILNGANIVRVHDVKATKQAAMMADAIMQAQCPAEQKAQA